MYHLGPGAGIALDMIDGLQRCHLLLRAGWAMLSFKLVKT